jgi:hypothetical protein
MTLPPCISLDLRMKNKVQTIIIIKFKQPSAKSIKVTNIATFEACMC